MEVHRMDEIFDRVSKGMARATSRRQALKLFGAGLAGTTFAALAGTAAAAPASCVTCICGVGRPCNPKSTTCTTTRGFPSAEAACQGACAAQNQDFCGAGNQFHCPKGCP
jgi:hypothetical protein